MNVEMVAENNTRPTNESSNQQLITCEICIEPTLNPDKRFMNDDVCSHPFCTDCMINYIRAKLEYDNIGHIKCPALNCDRILDPIAFASVLDPATFLRWTDVLCELAIISREKCYCPYINCNVLIVNECDGKPTKSKCPSCKRMFCFHCERVWHAGFTCEEGKKFRDRNDVAFGRLAESRKWKRCPRCRYFIERKSGCRGIKCRCGIIFCYKCGKQVCSCSTQTAIREREPPTWRQMLVFYIICLALYMVIGILADAIRKKT